MAESMERGANTALNKCKEELGIPLGGSNSHREKKRVKKSKKYGSDSSSDQSEESESGSESNKAIEVSEAEDDVVDDEDAGIVLFREKTEFLEKVRKLKNEDFTKLVKKIKNICPGAVEDVNEDKLQIHIDKLERKSFSILEALV